MNQAEGCTSAVPDSCLSSISFPMKQSDMYICLNGLKLYAFHGVLPQENKIGAEYTLNLRLKTDFSRASQTDDLQSKP